MSEVDNLIQAVSVFFSHPPASSDQIRYANEYLINYTALKECFLSSVTVAIDESKPAPFRNFCANILYNKIRRQITQLQPEEQLHLIHMLSESLQRALLSDPSPSRSSSGSGSLSVIPALLRCITCLSVIQGIPGIDHLHNIASSLVAHGSVGSMVLALRLFVSVAQELEEIHISNKHHRDTICSHLSQILKGLLSQQLEFMLVNSHDSNKGEVCLVGLQLFHAVIRTGNGNGSGNNTSSSSSSSSSLLLLQSLPMTSALLQAGLSAFPASDDSNDNDDNSILSESHAAIRAMLTRLAAASDNSNNQEAASLINLKIQLLQWLLSSAHKLLTINNNSKGRREVLLSLLTTAPTLVESCEQPSHPYCHLSQQVLLAIIQLARQPPRSLLLLTLDLWMELPILELDSQQGLRGSRFLGPILLRQLLTAILGLCRLTPALATAWADPSHATSSGETEEELEDLLSLRDPRLGLHEAIAVIVDGLGATAFLSELQSLLVLEGAEGLLGLELALFALSAAMPAIREDLTHDSNNSASNEVGCFLLSTAAMLLSTLQSQQQSQQQSQSQSSSSSSVCMLSALRETACVYLGSLTYRLTATACDHIILGQQSYGEVRKMILEGSLLFTLSMAIQAMTATNMSSLSSSSLSSSSSSSMSSVASSTAFWKLCSHGSSLLASLHLQLLRRLVSTFADQLTSPILSHSNNSGQQETVMKQIAQGLLRASTVVSDTSMESASLVASLFKPVVDLIPQLLLSSNSPIGPGQVTTVDLLLSLTAEIIIGCDLGLSAAPPLLSLVLSDLLQLLHAIYPSQLAARRQGLLRRMLTIYRLLLSALGPAASELLDEVCFRSLEALQSAHRGEHSAAAMEVITALLDFAQNHLMNATSHDNSSHSDGNNTSSDSSDDQRRAGLVLQTAIASVDETCSSICREPSRDLYLDSGFDPEALQQFFRFLETMLMTAIWRGQLLLAQRMTIIGRACIIALRRTRERELLKPVFASLMLLLTVDGGGHNQQAAETAWREQVGPLLPEIVSVLASSLVVSGSSLPSSLHTQLAEAIMRSLQVSIQIGHSQQELSTYLATVLAEGEELRREVDEPSRLTVAMAMVNLAIKSDRRFKGLVIDIIKVSNREQTSDALIAYFLSAS